MMSEPAFQKFTSGATREITSVEAERFFRVDDYVIGDARKNKILRTKAAFRTDTDLKPAIDHIATLIRDN